MANKEHLQPLIKAIASQSMAPWNHWRIENPNILPDLLGVELVDINLSFASLSYADLSHADLRRSNLHHATLRHTDLRSTDLQEADLSEADLSYADLKGADLRGAILRNAKLRGTNLIGASLRNADLRGADLTDTLMDAEAIERPKKWISQGVSQLEKLALGLFTRTKGEYHMLPDGGVKTPRSDKHI
jgi:uncharacterized protein YjbI with pentapeptide repeats